MSTRTPELFANKELRIGIIGCGYVGLPLALRFAEAGHRVIGFDVDPTKVDKLNAGQTYIRHIPADEIRRWHVRRAVSPPPRTSRAWPRWTPS